jgi:hypothetical protein
LGGSSDDKSSTSPCDGKQVAAKAAPHDLASRESLPNREARRRSLGHDKEDILQVSEIFQEEDQMPQSSGSYNANSWLSGKNSLMGIVSSNGTVPSLNRSYKMRFALLFLHFTFGS